MKKLFQEPRWERIARSRTERARKRHERKASRAELVAAPKFTYPTRPLAGGQVQIAAPSVFSLTTNLEETIRFFEATYSYINSRRSVFLDLRAVTQLTADAMVYMLSMIEHARLRGLSASISGNNPADPRCDALLRKCGFYRYVFTTRKHPSTVGGDVFAIKTGTLVQPQVVGELKRFVDEMPGSRDGMAMRHLYRVLIECMANTKNHAYEQSSVNRFRWWVMAFHDPESQDVEFVFIDNGLGIPATVRRKFRESTLEFLTTSALAAKHLDGALIASALRGELRTRTKQSYRGKGLPSMQAACAAGVIRGLRVVSRHGVVDAATGEATTLPQRFRGTMISWRLPALLLTLAPGGLSHAQDN